VNEHVDAMNFWMAIQAMLNLKKVTRLEWKNPNLYGFIKPGKIGDKEGTFFHYHKEDGDHPWILVVEDVEAKDWIVLPGDVEETPKIDQSKEKQIKDLENRLKILKGEATSKLQ